MSLPVEWLEEAVAEASEARRWYRQQDPAASRKFVEELKSAEHQIALMPQATAPGKFGTRFTVLHSFPYVIHFRVDSNRILILAVSHSRRHPDYWHSRLP